MVMHLGGKRVIGLGAESKMGRRILAQQPREVGLRGLRVDSQACWLSRVVIIMASNVHCAGRHVRSR